MGVAIPYGHGSSGPPEHHRVVRSSCPRFQTGLGAGTAPDGLRRSACGEPVYDLITRAATIVPPAPRLVADVAILDGRIAYVGPRPPRPGREEISAIGKFLMPGVI